MVANFFRTLRCRDYKNRIITGQEQGEGTCSLFLMQQKIIIKEERQRSSSKKVYEIMKPGRYASPILLSCRRYNILENTDRIADFRRHDARSKFFSTDKSTSVSAMQLSVIRNQLKQKYSVKSHSAYSLFISEIKLLRLMRQRLSICNIM